MNTTPSLTLLFFAFLLTALIALPSVNLVADEGSYFGARFKEGQGIELSEETRSVIGLQTTEVKEVQRGTQNIAVVPASSLLKTVTGTYVYIVNGKYYLRTAVKVQAVNDSDVEVSDGLFEGDEIVVKPVNNLWYAELQALRSGKACADGH